MKDVKARIVTHRVGRYWSCYLGFPDICFPVRVHKVDGNGNEFFDEKILKEDLKKYMSEIIDQSDVVEKILGEKGEG